MAIHLGQELEVPRGEIHLDEPTQVFWKALSGQVLGDLRGLQYLNLEGQKQARECVGERHGEDEEETGSGDTVTHRGCYCDASVGVRWACGMLGEGGVTLHTRTD